MAVCLSYLLRGHLKVQVPLSLNNASLVLVCFKGTQQIVTGKEILKRLNVLSEVKRERSFSLGEVTFKCSTPGC